jgi:hypothetical protein
MNKSMRTLRKFGRSNKVVLAVIGGAIAGIAISRVFRTERAGALLTKVQKGIAGFSAKVADRAHRQPGTEQFDHLAN